MEQGKKFYGASLKLRSEGKMFTQSTVQVDGFCQRKKKGVKENVYR